MFRDYNCKIIDPQVDIQFLRKVLNFKRVYTALCNILIETVCS